MWYDSGEVYARGESRWSPRLGYCTSARKGVIVRLHHSTAYCEWFNVYPQSSRSSPHNGTSTQIQSNRLVVLFKKGHWKIADFGIISEATSNRLVTSHSARGKPSYRAPELLRETKSGYNNKADMWSLGCIAYELLTGQKAFIDDFQVFQYATSRMSLITFLKTSNSFTKIYAHEMLDVDPKRRPSARELLKLRFRTELPPESTTARPPGRKEPCQLRPHNQHSSREL